VTNPKDPIYLLTRFKYDPATGEIFDTLLKRESFRKKNAWGYLTQPVCNVTLMAHKVAWLFIAGEWREGPVDHINGERDDNRAVNLRAVSKAENNRNLSIPKNNTSGVIGVYYFKRTDRWAARIKVDRRTINLGYFTTIEEAAHARKQAERRFGFHTNHGRALSASAVRPLCPG
jgi:hypothetical protein